MQAYVRRRLRDHHGQNWGRSVIRRGNTLCQVSSFSGVVFVAGPRAPPFSSMNSTPAASKARRIAKSLAVVNAVSLQLGIRPIPLGKDAG
jgi:osmotically-inducible protein OsmY